MKKFLIALLSTLLLSGLFACEVKNPQSDGTTTQTQTTEAPHTHTWGEPSVAENGDKVYTCSGCEETKTEPHAHVYSDEWTSDATNHWHACTATGCVEKSEITVHQWGDPVVIKAPTSDEAGEKEYTCSVCGKTKKDRVERLPAKMSEEDWNEAFAFENVKIDSTCQLGDEESVISYLVDGEIVQMIMDDLPINADREVLVSMDFSGFYDVFNHYGNGVYQADLVCDEEMLMEYVDVTVTFVDGKIESISYTVDMDILGKLVYEFAFSEWGSVNISFPELDEETLAGALDASNFENYTVYISEMVSDDEYYETCMMFDGDRFYISIIDANEDETENEGTLENAGMVMMPELTALADILDATKFVYDAETMSFAYTEEIENFMESDLTITELNLWIEDGALIAYDLIYDGGSEISCYFEDYGVTEIVS